MLSGARRQLPCTLCNEAEVSFKTSLVSPLSSKESLADRHRALCLVSLGYNASEYEMVIVPVAANCDRLITGLGRVTRKMTCNRRPVKGLIIEGE